MTGNKSYQDKTSLQKKQEPPITQKLREIYVLMVVLHLSRRMDTELQTRELLELGRIIKDITQTSDTQNLTDNSQEEWQQIEKAARIVAGID